MKTVRTPDMDVTMSMKGKGTNKQYAFNDFSDLIKIPQIRKKTKIDKNPPKESIQCNLTHVYQDGKGWRLFKGVIAIKDLRRQFGKIQEVMYSFDNEVFGSHYDLRPKNSVH